MRADATRSRRRSALPILALKSDISNGFLRSWSAPARMASTTSGALSALVMTTN